MSEERSEKLVVLPDGTAFGVFSLPLPEDHWIYAQTPDGFTPPPPMPLRMGTGAARQEMVEKIRAAARYAVQAATMRGREMDFDPDALVQNMVIGLLGYFTEDGLSPDSWDNPEPVPPLYGGPEAP